MSDDRRILLLAIHYHNTDAVQAFAEQVFQVPVPSGWTRRLVIVDNSTDLDPALSWPPAVQVCRPGQNLGYFGGCAHGLKQYREAEGDLPAWVVVTNTDIDLADDFFERLLGADWPEHVGLVAPDVQTPYGQRQNPFWVRRPWRLGMRSYQWIFRWLWLTRLYTELNHLRWTVGSHLATRTNGHGPGEPVSIYAPHGSIMAFRRVFFERGGTLDYGGFMFGEEIHVAEQARQCGLDVVWQPGLRVIHHQQSTTEQVDVSEVRRWHLESTQYLWSTYFAE